MGIQGLLQSLRPIQRTINISEYRGKTVAVDGHCILHRGGFGAATKLALNQPTDSYVNYFMQFMGLLEYHGVTPIVVFDGLPLPLKQITNDERRRNRQTALKQGLHLYEQGKIAAAEKFFQQSVSISNEMIIAVIRKLMEKKIQCIVAPNEADAQLTHLANTGKVDAVVTEDSDLLAFGCTKVIYKIDRYGDGIEICMDKVINDYRSTLYEYDAETIRHICILSGCDYLPSVKGVGLKTILKRYEINRNTDQALYHLQHQFKKDFPADYIEKFYFANLGFLHQWVYDMDEKNYVRLNPLPSECTEDDVRLLGRIPTVQDSTMFRVNKVIPKPKSKDTPLKEAITEEFLGYTQSAKENITPSHMGTPFSAPPSTKSPKSPTLSFGATTRRVLSELNLPHHSSNAIPVVDSTSGESSSYISRPRVATQGERLEALYKRCGVLPRKSRQITSESTDKLPFTNALADNSGAPSSKSESASSRGIKNMFLGTDIGSASNLPTVYARDRDTWMSYLKQKCSPPPPPALPSTVKRLYHRMKSKKDAPESPLSPPPHSPISPPPSVEQPSMPLTETTAISTTPQVDVVEPNLADVNKITEADTTEATDGYPISPPFTSPTEDEMLNIITPTNTSDTTAATDNISPSIPKVSHDLDQTSSKVNSRHSLSSSSSHEQDKAFYNQYTPAKPASKWTQFVNTSPSSGSIPSNVHTSCLKSNTATATNNHHTTLYNRHTPGQSVNTTPSSLGTPSTAHTDHATTITDATPLDDLFVCSQYKLVKFLASQSAQPVHTTAPSDHRSSIPHTIHSASNANDATAATNSNANSSSKYFSSDSRRSRSNKLPDPTHVLSSVTNNQCKKRSFDQTGGSESTFEGSQLKKVHRLPPSSTHHSH